MRVKRIAQEDNTVSDVYSQDSMILTLRSEVEPTNYEASASLKKKDHVVALNQLSD